MRYGSKLHKMGVAAQCFKGQNWYNQLCVLRQAIASASRASLYGAIIVTGGTYAVTQGCIVSCCQELTSKLGTCRDIHGC